MGIGTEFLIHQTLHGYAEGHTLLASSCELSTAEKKQLLSMSDLSGSPLNPTFLSYLTAYPLPGRKYYAFARTWQAVEMSRPGCVWTQTLLINATHLGQLKNLDFLNNLFIRPQKDGYSFYSDPIISRVETDSFSFDLWSNESINLYKQITDNLYSRPTKKLLVSADTPSLYEPILLSIWSRQWPRLRRRFSFCSGAFAPRRIDGTPLDCQIALNRLTQHSSSNSSDEFVLLYPNPSGDLSPWVDSMIKIPGDQLLSFMYQYGSDVKGVRSRFIGLLYAYQLYHNSQLNKISFGSLFDFLTKYFPSPEEAKRLKKELINIKLGQDIVSAYEFIEIWLNSSWLAAISELSWDIPDLITQIWSSNSFSDGQVSHLLQMVGQSQLSRDDRLSTIEGLPMNYWLEVDWIDISLLTELLLKKPILVESQLVWQTTLPVQQRWIQALETISTVNWLSVNEKMLLAENDQWVSVIFQQAGVQALISSLTWAELTDRILPKAWESVIVEQGEEFFNWIADQKKISPYLSDLIVKLFKPVILPLTSVEANVWHKVAVLALNNTKPPHDVRVLTLLFTACLVQNKIGALDMVINIFKILHRRAEENQLENISWQILKSLEQVRPFAKRPEGIWNLLFRRKDNPPREWDRCEYLRQVTVDYFIINDWPQSAFARMITDKDVFIRIANYCLSFKEGKVYLAKLKRYLKGQNMSTPQNQLELIREVQRFRLNKDKD